MQHPAPDRDGPTDSSSVGERLRAGADRSANGQEGDKPTGGELNAAIARAVVRIHRDRVGRGPDKARAFFDGNIVVVVLEDLLVTAERTLLASGHEEGVIRLRHELLETMRLDLITAIERLTDRHVIALIGQTNLEPDLAIQMFVLDLPIHAQPAAPPARRA